MWKPQLFPAWWSLTGIKATTMKNTLRQTPWLWELAAVVVKGRWRLRLGDNIDRNSLRLNDLWRQIRWCCGKPQQQVCVLVQQVGGKELTMRCTGIDNGSMNPRDITLLWDSVCVCLGHNQKSLWTRIMSNVNVIAGWEMVWVNH